MLFFLFFLENSVFYSLFRLSPEENKKNILKCCLLKFLSSVLSFKVLQKLFLNFLHQLFINRMAYANSADPGIYVYFRVELYSS